LSIPNNFLTVSHTKLLTEYIKHFTIRSKSLCIFRSKTY